MQQPDQSQEHRQPSPDGEAGKPTPAVTNDEHQPNATPEQQLAIAPASKAAELKQKRELVEVVRIKKAIDEALNENSQIKELVKLNQPAASSKDDASELKESFRQTVLDAFCKEYEDLSSTWQALETKAQGTVTIAGIFVAAAFTFAKDLTTTRLDFYGNLLLGATICSLVSSVLFSVLSLKTREVDAIPSGAQIEDWSNLIEETGGDLQTMKIDFIDEQSKLWRKTVDSARKAVSQKEDWLQLAQGFLVTAIAMAAAVTLKLLKI